MTFLDDENGAILHQIHLSPLIEEQFTPHVHIALHHYQVLIYLSNAARVKVMLRGIILKI